eukprot:scaffold106301_cov14-Tisochrysis_lutea.AAC.1
MVRLAFPAEHRPSLSPPSAAATPAAGAASGKAGVTEAAAASAEGSVSAATGVEVPSVPATAAAAAPGSEHPHTEELLPTAAVPPALSQRARAVLGYAALALQDPVLLAVCRCVRG